MCFKPQCGLIAAQRVREFLNQLLSSSHIFLDIDFWNYWLLQEKNQKIQMVAGQILL